jgi:6-pyruvoyltetrahydropterin/6-carboxytetrahydropterin synthase
MSDPRWNGAIPRGHSPEASSRQDSGTPGGGQPPYIPAMSLQVSVAKESLSFSAAHFLTLPGHMCERLHGHNYQVSAVVEGAVDPVTGFVVDFAVLKQAIRALITPMDHRVLIPTGNPALAVRQDDQRVLVDYAWPEWLVVPLTHACLVPVAHTTAELLAEWMGREMWSQLQTGPAAGIRRLTLEVEESSGQTAAFTISREE